MSRYIKADTFFFCGAPQKYMKTDITITLTNRSHMNNFRSRRLHEKAEKLKLTLLNFLRHPLLEKSAITTPTQRDFLRIKSQFMSLNTFD